MMRKNDLKLMTWIFAFGLAFTSFSCNDDESEISGGNGEVEFEITDAPSDDANIEGVIVTIAEIKVDGKTVEGFQKQTVDLKAYQEGRTKILGGTTLASKTYGTITLVLDLDKDENGNEPGCYVLTKDQSKFKLRSNSEGRLNLDLKKNWLVENGGKTKLVMDFDLRKSIQNSTNQPTPYSFVSDSQLAGAVRVVDRNASGTVKGTFRNESNTSSDKVLVYAYKKGTFNASTETQSDGGVAFANAVASTEVKNTITGNSYTLAFLEEGEYELHFIAYNEDENGRAVFQTELTSETEVDGSVGNIVNIKAGLTLNVASKITGSL